MRLLTELIMMRCANGINLKYPSRVCLSKTKPLQCLFTSLLTLSKSHSLVLSKQGWGYVVFHKDLRIL